MADTENSSGESGGHERASDFSNAMLGLPGYADDSMLFVMRYTARVKSLLRECDFNEFMKAFGEMHKALDKLELEPSESSDNNAAQAEEAQAEEVQAAKQRALEKIQAYPDMVRDFDQLQKSARLAKDAVDPKRWKNWKK